MRVEIDNKCYSVEFAEVRGDTLYLLLLGGDIEIHVIGHQREVRELFKKLVVYGYIFDSMLDGMKVEEVDV